MAVMMTTLDQNGSLSQGMGWSINPSHASAWLIRPSYENMLLNSTEYATSEVTQGRNTAVRSSPRKRRFGMFRQLAMTRASTIMSGTWMMRKIKVFCSARRKIGSLARRTMLPVPTNSMTVPCPACRDIHSDLAIG